MSIQIFNTRTANKTPLLPMEEGHVKMYVCGITAYDYCHIGHARSALVFDMIVKYLRHRGYKVTFVRNFTDIDDKIINRAKEQNTSCEELSQRFIKAFHEDMVRLGIDPPDIEPKATEYVGEIIDFVKRLVDRGFAYQSGNDVYFSVDTFPDYGKLSSRSLEDMKAGARVSINENKKNPMDFALWKGSKPGEPTWDSPWGPGRPGWHIECSAMSQKLLGDSFDIHGGGKDLTFPHHENELAQSEAASGKPFVNIWIHHGFVTIKDEKMSKSLGNFLTIRDVLDNYHPEVLRFLVFSTHYRNPLDFSEMAMQDAEVGLERLYSCMAAIDVLSEGEKTPGPRTASIEEEEKLSTLEKRFCEVMDNDFNTAQGLGILFEGVKILNRIRQSLSAEPNREDVVLLRSSAATITKLARIMGLLCQKPQNYLREQRLENLEKLDIQAEEIERLIEQRKEARKQKNWARADEIRDFLQKKNVELKDGPEGTTWTIIKR
jgi:cysteinyl-tRNA synthetase